MSSDVQAKCKKSLSDEVSGPSPRLLANQVLDGLHIMVSGRLDLFDALRIIEGETRRR